jgi:plasmid maintenance system antidote protein VapI
MTRQKVHDFVNDKICITPEMMLRLDRAVGRSSN